MTCERVITDLDSIHTHLRDKKFSIPPSPKMPSSRSSVHHNSCYLVIFSIIATCVILVIIPILMFNHAKISSHNRNQNIITDHGETRWTPKAFPIQTRAEGWETYTIVDHCGTTTYHDGVSFTIFRDMSSLLPANSTRELASFNTSYTFDASFTFMSINNSFFFHKDVEVIALKEKVQYDSASQVKKKKKRRIVLTSAVVLLGVVLIVLFLVFVLFVYLRNKKISKNEYGQQIENEISTGTFEFCSPRAFTFEDLSRATNSFHQDQILGVGGFGAVYRGVLPNGKKVAIKRVSSSSQQGIQEYKAEVTIVSRSNHRNLVQLVGWCHKKEGELLVVYELMENLSLDVHLFKSQMAPLNWDVRYKVAQGLAKALHYLHEECGELCVIHGDIKSSNVLLDSKFKPKLGDFGLAKVIDHDKTMEISVLAGTRGYLAPEYVLTGKISPQSDVYSYGVVALELATGRKTIDPNAEDEQKLLIKWVQNLYKLDRILEAVDPKLGDDYDELQVKGILVVGLWCVLHDLNERPSMKEIVRVLDNTQDPLLNLQIPSLVHDSVPHDFGSSILETTSRSSHLVVSLEMETPTMDVVGDTVVPEPEDRDHAYSPWFVWRRVWIVYYLSYLHIDITWLRPSRYV